VAWFALAAGLYAIAVFVRQPASRALLPIWAGGQCLAALSYVALFFLVVRPVAENTDAPGLIATYLKGAFPQPGQNPIVFFLIGAAKQLIYIAGGPAGAIILGLFGSVGLAAWYRSGDSRWVMVTGIYLTAIGAYAKFFPFGMSRHSVLIGLLSLAAAGAGIDALGQVWRGARVAVTGVLVTLAIFNSVPDVHNIDLDFWQKDRWERAWVLVDEAVPAGSTLLADGEATDMLRHRFMPRDQRRVGTRNPRTVIYKGQLVTTVARGDWAIISTPVIEAAIQETSGSVWLIDTGFNVDALKSRQLELGIATVVDEPGVLYLGRLR